ncbi:MAG: FMN-binding protein [Clostridia bacterium]|nr:FMN-binding protein [Clostridia bacterium]
MNKYVKSVTVLFSICLVIALLLAAVNFITAPIIEEAKKKAETESLSTVLEGAEDFEKYDLTDGVPETVTAIYKETSGLGYAITLSTKSQYSEDNMLITVGIGADRIIKGIKITNYTESKALPESYTQSYVGKDSNLENIDTYAGVTYSSRAYKDAISDAFAGLDTVLEGEKEAN